MEVDAARRASPESWPPAERRAECREAVRGGALFGIQGGAELRGGRVETGTQWEYGVRTVLDLRAEDECEPELVPRPAGITTVRVPLDSVGMPFYDHWVTIDNLSSPLYYPAMLAEHPEPVIAAVRAIADAAPGCVVFHCAGGKHRTGLLAMPDFLLANGLTEAELTRLRTRLEAA